MGFVPFCFFSVMPWIIGGDLANYSILALIGFNGFYYFESKRDILFDEKVEYKELRKKLTVLVSICFLVTIAYIVNPYS